MKIVSNSDIQSVGTVNKSIDFGIDKKNIGILFRGFSDTLYSNKIGSIVREVTSNCFDSHREADIKDDVVITMVPADPLTGKNGKISFQDVGVGLSPERIKDIYSKYFSSTKRDTNNEIGGFGIGAKSPLAYTDVFEVNTIYGGISYNYVVHRGEEVPVIKLLKQEKSTERNGTTVILPVRAGDEEKFKDECKHQLRFFSNIRYIGLDIDRDYKVIQGKHWIASTDNNTEYNLSICLGGVSYPLDKSLAELSEYTQDDSMYCNYWNRTTIALKFDIGEIDVTMSRESIEYNDRTIKAIKDKYKLARQELIDMYQTNWDKVTDFRQYFIDCNHRNSSIIKLPVGEYTIDISFTMRSADRPKFAPWGVAVDQNMLSLILKTYRIIDGQRNLKKYGNEAHTLFTNYDLDHWFRKADKLSSLKSNYIHDEVIQSGTFVCVEAKQEPDWNRSTWYKDAQEDYKIVKPLLLKYIKDNTRSYDKIVVPESYKPVVPTRVKTKAPRGAVCARIPHYERYYHRDSQSDITYKKHSTTYVAVEELINSGTTIIYGTQDEIEILDKFSYIFSYMGGRMERRGDVLQIGRERVQIHKIAGSHVKHYSNMGALSIKEYIIKNYNWITSFKEAETFNNFYKHLNTIIENTNIFPKSFEGIFTKTSMIENYGQVDPVFNTRRRGDMGEEYKEGKMEVEVKKLLEYYGIPYVSDNFSVNGYCIKSINNMFRSIFNEIYYLTYTVDVSPSNLREYKDTPEKGLNILKSIIKDHYKVVYYKINKFK